MQHNVILSETKNLIPSCHTTTTGLYNIRFGVAKIQYKQRVFCNQTETNKNNVQQIMHYALI